MNSRRIAAVLALPSAFALAACSSSTTNGTGQVGGSSGAGGTTPPTTSNSGGSGGSSAVTSPSGGGVPTDAAGLGGIMQAAVASTTSAHITLSVDAAGQTITGSGDEKLSGGKLVAMDLTENLPGGVGSIELIIVGGKTYGKLPSSLNKTGKPYVLITEDSTDPTIKQLASTLDSTLSSASIGSVSLFIDAAKSVKLDGKETVGGVETSHYSVVVDVSKLPASLPGRSDLEATGLSTIPIEMYVDSQGRPVQVTENFSVQGESVSTKIGISNYNKPVSISAPPASQVGTG